MNYVAVTTYQYHWGFYCRSHW